MHIERVTVPVSEQAPTGTTNAYVLGADAAVLVDPGAQTRRLDGVLEGCTVDHIVATHTHPDHVGGLARYADELDATVWARRGWVDRFEAETGVTPDATLAEGTTIHADADVSVVALPGHAPDHIALIVESGGGTAGIVGDLAIASGSVAVGASDGDMRAYYTALRRLHAQDHRLLYPGHGPPITDPQTRVRALLAHRLARERQVETAVTNGVETVPAIVDTVYDKDLSGVESLAASTVVAHLEKLGRERRITWDGDRATPPP